MKHNTTNFEYIDCLHCIESILIVDLIPMASLDSAENLVNRLKTSIHAAFPCQLKDQHLVSVISNLTNHF